MKRHILEDKKFHNYVWDYKNKKTILYVDGEIYKGKDNMSCSYWFKGEPKKKNLLFNFLRGILDNLKISKNGG